MLVQIPELLRTEQVNHCRQLLAKTEWIDGKVTAGHQSATAKNNLQVNERDPHAKELGDLILSALEQNPLFIAAALPLKVFPPLFNRYEEGQSFGNHVDNAIRQVPGTNHRVRTDLSATLYFSNPDEYDGGELVIEDTYGVHAIKLPAGSMILYPASSLHHVRPITRGARVASFFWIQSMVRDDGERALLFDLDLAIQKLSADVPQHASVIELTSLYHNLLRRWSDV